MTLQNILHSPVYAGIYADGRRRVARGPDQWLVAIPGVLPAYITVEQYQANLARLAANSPGPRPPAWCAPGRRCCRGWHAADGG
jgi:Recombinase